jgi:hypothetical protein
VVPARGAAMSGEVNLLSSGATHPGDAPCSAPKPCSGVDRAGSAGTVRGWDGGQWIVRLVAWVQSMTSLPTTADTRKYQVPGPGLGKLVVA